MLKDGLSTGMQFLRRRFSAQDDDDEAIDVALEAAVPQTARAAAPAPPPRPGASRQASQGDGGTTTALQQIYGRVTSSTISAPASPSRTGESLAAAVSSAVVPSGHANAVAPADLTSNVALRQLLVLDSAYVDWTKYFRIGVDFALHVEQADWDEVNLCVDRDGRAIAEIARQGREIRQIRVDFALIPRASSKHESLIYTLLAAGVPMLNPARCTRAFLRKFALKMELRRRRGGGGSEELPLLPIEYYPQFRRFTNAPQLPCVLALGRPASGGVGKLRIQAADDLKDVETMLTRDGAAPELTVEPFVDAKYDVHVQRIGGELKTFVRKGISGHWKSCVGSSMLQAVPISARHASWLDALCQHVGGAVIASIDILVDKEGREWIHDVSDTVGFLGESQEDDRRLIASLVLARIRPTPQNPRADPTLGPGGAKSRPSGAPPPLPERKENGTAAAAAAALPPAKWLPEGGRENATTGPGGGNFADDTMGQLKRTFAGFFGDSSSNAAAAPSNNNNA